MNASAEKRILDSRCGFTTWFFSEGRAMKALFVGLLAVALAQSLLFWAGDAWGQSTQQLAIAIAKSHALFYRTLQTYTEEATVAYEFQGKVGGVDLAQRSSTGRLRLTFLRGKGFALESTDTALYVDGDSLTLYRPMEGQYVVRKIRNDPSLEDLLEQLDPPLRIVRWHPAILGLFGKAGPQGTVVPEVTNWDSIGRDRLGEREVWHVRSRVGRGSGGAGDLPLDIWLDAALCQVLKVELDMSPMLKAQLPKLGGASPPGSATPISAKVVFSVLKSARNPVMDEGCLRFRPGEGDRKVPRLEFQAPALVGTRAPSFEGTTLGGDRFSLEANRGKLVLLDFWATWCGKCVAHLPHLQKISGEFADDLVVVGVNADDPDRADQVRRVLADAGCTFPQVLDTQGAIRRQFRVAGLPVLVLIDRKGIVCDVYPAPTPFSRLRGRIQEQLGPGKSPAEPPSDAR
jgi:thiol-disulfide isomerase/thioredoxin